MRNHERSSSDAALEYVQKEVDTCERLIAGMDDSLSKQEKLRTLYELPSQREAVYCESGTVEENLVALGVDRTLVIPVFPYPSESGLAKNVASVELLLRETLQTQRVVPVIQHPGYYTDLNHFGPILDEAAPASYFVRGQYAYAIAFERPLEMVEGRYGNPLLKEIHDLMEWARENHSDVIDIALGDESCWEHRWKTQRRRDDQFYDRLRQSLRYRYGSVAFCIGRNAADAILEHFDAAPAWRILLHLHILFDHVLAHGCGSDYAVAPVTAEGLDFHQARVQLPSDFQYGIKPVPVSLPRRLDGDLEELLQEHHFLHALSLDSYSPEAIRNLRYELDQRIKAFEGKLAKLSGHREMISKGFEITFLVAGALQALGGLEWSGLTTVFAGVDKITGIPRWISEEVLEALARGYRRELATYMIQAATEVQ